MHDTENQTVEPALRWIVGILERHGVPFQAVGGLAARAYGATRPIVDLDFYIPAASVATVVDAVRPHITRPPSPYRGERWNLTFMRLEYAGQAIELGVADSAKYRDAAAGRWRDAAIDFAAGEPHELFGVRVPVMPRDPLTVYKRRLARAVDRADVEEITDG